MRKKTLNKKYENTGKKLIVKYGNRKLYDTDEGKYTSLAQIIDLPKESFVVISHNTKQDITSEIECRAVFEYFLSNLSAFESIKKNINLL